MRNVKVMMKAVERVVDHRVKEFLTLSDVTRLPTDDVNSGEQG